MASAVHSLNPFRKDSTSCGHCQLLPVVELLVSAVAASADSSLAPLALVEVAARWASISWCKCLMCLIAISTISVFSIRPLPWMQKKFSWKANRKQAGLWLPFLNSLRVSSETDPLIGCSYGPDDVFLWFYETGDPKIHQWKITKILKLIKIQFCSSPKILKYFCGWFRF